MKDQHKYIKGYRELSKEEIELINEVKSIDKALGELVRSVNSYLAKQSTSINSTEERDRIGNAEPYRWSSIARTQYQQGSMALIRAIAQPSDS